jgi:TRAP-type C4-dicarboxylate transport system permease large subunit
MVAEYISTLAIDPIWILGLIIVVYFVLGMFMDAISIMVLTMAVIFPTVTHLGYDPIWFGVVVVILLEIGLITPPVGMNLFTIQSLDPRRISLADVAWGSAPFVVLMLIALMFLIAFPQIALWLPSRM